MTRYRRNLNCGLGVLLILLLVALASAQTPSTPIVRTLVYRQITQFDTSPNVKFQQSPVLSDDGNRIVYAIAPGTQDPARPNRIFMINVDGSDMREVDAYQTFCFCGSLLDINHDGSRVISTDAVQLRIADTAGGGGHELVALSSNEIKTIRIAGDGSKVFFIARRDSALRGTTTPIQRGLYAVNPDGSGLRQIVGPDRIAALLGLQPSVIFPFDVSGISLDVSHDGQRLVFGAQGQGERLFSVQADGSGLRELFGPARLIMSMGISGDGEVVAYNVGDEGHTIHFNGSMDQVIAANATFRFTDGNTQGDRTTLSANGSRVLFGSFGHLFNADGNGQFQLATRSRHIDSRFFINGVTSPRIFRPVMDRTGKRVLFLSKTP